MLLFFFLPLFFTILAANLVPAGRIWRWLTLANLVGMAFFILLAGFSLILIDPEIFTSMLSPEVVANLNLVLPGALVLLTVLLSMLSLIPAVRRVLIQALGLKLDIENMVHTVAWVFAIWLVGLTVAQVLVIQDLPPEVLIQGSDLSLSNVWEQGIAFVLLAILGVGLGLRRSIPEAMARLGMTLPTPRQLGIALAAIIILSGWDALLSLTWQTLDPDSFERISSISEGLFANMMTPIGALSIGLSAGIGEELLFRGAIQSRFGLIWATILFTVGHIQYEISPALLSVFLIGLVLGIIRQRYNTTTAILIHAGYNTLNVFLALGGT